VAAVPDITSSTRSATATTSSRVITASNARFAAGMRSAAQRRRDLVWVHDYQLSSRWAEAHARTLGVGLPVRLLPCTSRSRTSRALRALCRVAQGRDHGKNAARVRPVSA
jgi:hypothetical protein